MKTVVRLAREATGSALELEVNRWYVDVSPGAAVGLRFRVLNVNDDTVRVDDDRGGGPRVVNRLMFEAQMQPCDAPPKKPLAKAGARRSTR